MKLRQYDIFGDYVDEQVSSMGDDYADFTAKFEPKKTTDDCYTPAPVYDAVLGFCRSPSEQAIIDRLNNNFKKR